MALKPLDPRIKPLAPLGSDIGGSFSRDKKLPIPKDKDESFLKYSSKTADKVGPFKKVDSKNLANAFAKQKSGKAIPETMLSSGEIQSYNSSAEVKKTGSARYLDPKNIKSTALKPVFDPESVLDPQLTKLALDALERFREMDRTPISHEMQLKVKDFNNKKKT